MFWKNKKEVSQPIKAENKTFKTDKIEIPIEDISIPESSKLFPTRELIERVKPAVYHSGFVSLNAEEFKEERRLYNESLKPTHDIFEVEGFIHEHIVEIKAYRYTNVHSAIKNGKEIYDFGHDGSTIFNFIYAEEVNYLLGDEDYFRIYCHEKDLPYAKKEVREQLLKTLHIELTNAQMKINQLKNI